MKRKAPGKPRSIHSKGATVAPGESPVAARIEPADPIAALVSASARALDLPLDSAWHGAIAFNLRLIWRHAALVDEFHPPDGAEPAPVFHA
jgi:Protein of unknown function (DUF4089)